MKAYKIYNYRGKHVVLSFVPLRDEIMDEIEIRPAEGFSIEEDAYGIPYLEEKDTGIIYDIAHADINKHCAIMAPALKCEHGEIVQAGGRRTIAVVEQ